MENRILNFLVRLIALLAISFSALAGESGPSPEQQADWQLRLDKAAALLDDAKARQAVADQVLEDKKAVCAKKFLINGCLNDARKEHIAASKAARQVENEGKALERAVKKEQLTERDRRYGEAAPQREADLKAREAKVSAERQAGAEQRAATRADKARKAEEGSQRRAADDEKFRQKQAAHDARVANKMKEAERRSAEAAAQPK